MLCYWKGMQGSADSRSWQLDVALVLRLAPAAMMHRVSTGQVVVSSRTTAARSTGGTGVGIRVSEQGCSARFGLSRLLRE